MSGSAANTPRWWHGLHQQHAWVLAGDDRGTYGDYPPKQIA